MSAIAAPSPPKPGKSSDVASWLSWDSNSLTIQVVARPGASRRRIISVDPRGVVVALNSPPEKGRANDELIDFLARIASVPRSTITIVRGDTSRHKTIRITVRDPSRVAAVFLAAAVVATKRERPGHVDKGRNGG
jgi:uncharacterized protein (TIGR00251 family)